jgi:hypothetical protein
MGNTMLPVPTPNAAGLPTLPTLNPVNNLNHSNHKIPPNAMTATSTSHSSFPTGMIHASANDPNKSAAVSKTGMNKDQIVPSSSMMGLPPGVNNVPTNVSQQVAPPVSVNTVTPRPRSPHMNISTSSGSQLSQEENNVLDDIYQDNAPDVNSASLMDSDPLSGMPNMKSKQEQQRLQQVKNASAWKSMTQGSSQGPAIAAALPAPPQPTRKPGQAIDAFQQFQKKAKEKADRQRQLIELQENRRRETERQERERQRLEAERRQQREEEEALEKARRSMNPESAPVSASVAAIKTEHLSQSPSSSPGESDKAERERQRQREQERRRRQAMAGQIDMNLQSELLAAFEEDVITM